MLSACNMIISPVIFLKLHNIGAHPLVYDMDEPRRRYLVKFFIFGEGH